MGFVAKAVKSVVKGVGKVVKGVAKGIKSVAKGIAKAAKGIGKAFKKLGPIASIAMGFMMPQLGFFSKGILGGIQKGALTGFLTSGGKIKETLKGAAFGGLGATLGEAWQGAKGGWSASTGGLTDKIAGAIKGATNSVSDGFSNLYDATESFISGGGDVTSTNAGNAISAKTNETYIKTSISQNPAYKNAAEFIKDNPAHAQLFEETQALHGQVVEGNMADYEWSDDLGTWEKVSTGEALYDSPTGVTGSANPFADEYAKATGTTGSEAYKGYIEDRGGYLPTTDIITQEVVQAPSLKTPKKEDRKSLLGDWSLPKIPEVDAPQAPTIQKGAGTGYGSSMTAQQAWETIHNPAATPEQRAQAQEVIAQHQSSQQLQYGYA